MQQNSPTWQEAMTFAGNRLSMLEESFVLTVTESDNVPLYSAHAAVAQAWIAYARELTAKVPT